MRKVLDGLPAMIAYWDRDKRNLFANAACREWFGFTPEQMRGVHIREVLGEDVYAQNLPYIEGALGGEPQLFARTLIDTAGRVRHTQASYVPDLADDGQVHGFFVLVTDVTPRVEAQRALDGAQSIAEMGSWSLDCTSGELEWSDEMYRVAGVDRQRFTPAVDAYFELVHPDDRAMVRANLDRARASGVGYEIDYRLRRPDGAVRYVRGRGKPVQAPGGTVVRINGTLQDITEAQRAERELGRLNAELDRANRLQADLIAMLGHEARQPLALIRMLIESLIAAWGELSDEAKHEDLQHAVRATYELSQLFDDVLAMTYLESGRAVGSTTATRVVEAVDRCVALVPGGIDVRVDIDERIAVLAEPWHLRQMITNLINNAVKYGAAPFAVEAHRVGSAIEVSVSDHGDGVPETFVPHLFERFTRVQHSAKRGTGFGLYIVRRLAETNGGTVAYRRNEPTGAVFTLTLPAAP
jgi:PAS domain S-box-containing protein